MGVMECARNGCENIMCDKYIDDIGYICYECQKDFKNSDLGNIEFGLGHDEIKQNLSKFMKIDKRMGSNDRIDDMDDFFNLY